MKKKTIALIAILGAAFLVFKDAILGAVVTQIENGVLVTFQGVKLSFGNVISFTISGKQINIPTSATLRTSLKITNNNPIGGNLSFDGFVTYGNGGPVLVPANISSFYLSPGETKDVIVNSNINVLTAAMGIKEVFGKLLNKELSFLWITGVMNTDFGNFNINREIPVSL